MTSRERSREKETPQEGTFAEQVSRGSAEKTCQFIYIINSKIYIYI